MSANIIMEDNINITDNLDDEVNDIEEIIDDDVVEGLDDDEGLDTGNILFQKKVDIEKDAHTLLTSYQLLISEIEDLFKMNWRYLRTNECKGWTQQGAGSFHYAKDLEKVRHFLTKGWDTNISEFRSNYLKSIQSN